MEVKEHLYKVLVIGEYGVGEKFCLLLVFINQSSTFLSLLSSFFFSGKVGTDCSSHSCTFTVLPHELSNAHFRFSSRFTFFLYVPIFDYGRLPSFVVIRKVRAMLTLT